MIKLSDYDYTVVNLSGGKDGLWAAYVMTARARAEGCLDRVIAVHCDLGDNEWEGTLDVVRAQCAALSIERLEIVSNPRLSLWDRIEEQGMWPSYQTRYCTSEFKTGQVQKLFTQLIREAGLSGRKTRRCRILNVLGIRADEGGARDKKCAEMTSDGGQGAWEIDANSNKTTRDITRYYPVAFVPTPEVFTSVEAHGLPMHWAYAAGMKRLSCPMCPLAQRCDIETAAKLAPKHFARGLALEARIGHRFHNDYSLDDIAQAQKENDNA